LIPGLGELPRVFLEPGEDFEGGVKKNLQRVWREAGRCPGQQGLALRPAGATGLGIPAKGRGLIISPFGPRPEDPTERL
jgi:hypothetical protein